VENLDAQYEHQFSDIKKNIGKDGNEIKDRGFNPAEMLSSSLLKNLSSWVMRTTLHV
jgi:hypothetical protein